MAYATVDELAAALRIQVTPANTENLQRCLEAAAAEIDHAVDRVDPIAPGEYLSNRVNIRRAVEWFKANDAAFGVLGSADTGTLMAPRNEMGRSQSALTPLKQQWGVG